MISLLFQVSFCVFWENYRAVFVVKSAPFGFSLLEVLTSSLSRGAAVGEPINHEAWEWLHRVVGDSRCTLVDTWWQTGEHVPGGGAGSTERQLNGRLVCGERKLGAAAAALQL